MARPLVVLPIRDGLNPTRLRLPGDVACDTVVDYLVQRFPDDAARLREKIAAAEVVDETGTPIETDTPYRAGRFVYLYRDPPVEQPIPFDVEILSRDADLLVVDKPHFLASTPRGSFITETVLVRLRRQLDLPELSPVHRLDRLTAGILILTVRKSARRPYQLLFAERRVRKSYEAIARFDPALSLPRVVRSRIVKQPGVLQAMEVPGSPNSETSVELLGERGGFGDYRLVPATGKTHQLRVHLNSLGIPIAGDPLYPVVRDPDPRDFTDPLRLLARSIEFDDPLTGRRRRFVSERVLDRP